jgi:thiopurine S-methyltransferase
MDHAFWHERWQQNQIGFHNESVNSHLQNFWSAVQIAQNKQVLVPLCGKSKDILWLLAQGHDVVAVELSPLAVQAFFAENNLLPKIAQTEHFTLNQIDGLAVYCGDFFQLTAKQLADCAVVWDRASLVALPIDMRSAYARHLQHLLTPGAQIILVTFDYPQAEMQGPPFCVNDGEVRALYSGWCDIELLHSEDILDREQHFRDRGLSYMQEQVYLITVR